MHILIMKIYKFNVNLKIDVFFNGNSDVLQSYGPSNIIVYFNMM